MNSLIVNVRQIFGLPRLSKIINYSFKGDDVYMIHVTLIVSQVASTRCSIIIDRRRELLLRRSPSFADLARRLLPLIYQKDKNRAR